MATILEFAPRRREATDAYVGTAIGCPEDVEFGKLQVHLQLILSKMRTVRPTPSIKRAVEAQIALLETLDARDSQ